MTISIANLNFVLNPADAPLLDEPSTSIYRPFITDSKVRGKGAVDIQVDLKTGDCSPEGQSSEIFRCSSWAMSRKGDRYYLSINPFLHDGPECVAVFDPGVEALTIYCGDSGIVKTEGRTMLRNPFSYPLDQLLLMYALAEREGAFMHACAVELNNKGFIFPGRSGAGKSTISRIFALKGHGVLSDDRVAVRRIDGQYKVFGTPWPGDAGIAENRGLPVHGIFFISHGKENRIDRIEVKESFEKLMPVTSIPWYDRTVMPRVLSFCEDLATNVPAYELHFMPDTEVVNVLEGFLHD